MRRAVAWGCAVALILALAACGFVRWPLSAAKVGDSLNAAFGASPRLHWSAPQAATFSVLPWPSVRIVDARLDDAGGVNLLSAPTARLDLSLVELAARALHPHPRHSRQPDRDAGHRPPALRRGGGGLGRAPRASPGARAADEPEPDRTASCASSARGAASTLLIANVEGRLDGLTVGNQLRFNLSAEWRNAPIAIAGVLSDPEAAAKGASSRFEFALDSPLAKFAFDGAIALGEKPSAEGDMTASVPSIAALAALPRTPGGRPFLAADDIAISGKGQGGAGRAHARRCDDDQRRADVRRGDRDRRPRRAAGRLGHARRRNAGARAAARTAAAPVRLVGRVEREAVRAHAAAGLRPRLAPVGRPPRRLWPTARRRRRVRHGHGRQAQHESDRRCGLWRPRQRRSRSHLRRTRISSSARAAN